MREKFARFMAGRYGNDNLNKVISISSIVFLVISLITTRFVPFLASFCWILAIMLIVLCYYRMLSRNITKRSMENQKFMSLRYQAVVKKQHRAEITCPKCGEQFIRKS